MVVAVVLVGCASSASDEDVAAEGSSVVTVSNGGVSVPPVPSVPVAASLVPSVSTTVATTVPAVATSVVEVAASAATSVPSSTVVSSTSSVAVSSASSVPVVSTTVVMSSTTTPTTTTPVSGPRVVSLTIPDGTAARLAAGEDVGDVLPSRLTLRVGDTLELVNQDSTFHIYGPVSARSGETVRWLLPQEGVFTGLCTSNSDRTVTLTVVA